MGPAPTALWKVPTSPPLQLQDPSLKPQPLPPTLPVSVSPNIPWCFLQCSGRGRPRLVWGRGPWAQGGCRGRAVQAALGARPTSGGTRYKELHVRHVMRGKSFWRKLCDCIPCRSSSVKFPCLFAGNPGWKIWPEYCEFSLCLTKEIRAPPKETGRLAPRESCREVSKIVFFHFLIFCPARKFPKHVETCLDASRRFLT